MGRKGGEAVAEKRVHKETKVREAGTKGKTEVAISRGRRLDAATASRAIEVETSGSPVRLRQAARRLGASGRQQHVLVVPQRDVPKAREAMKKAGVGGTVRNISGTQRRTVRPTAGKGGGRTRAGKRS
jgi:hypothetical protein